MSPVLASQGLCSHPDRLAAGFVPLSLVRQGRSLGIVYHTGCTPAPSPTGRPVPTIAPLCTRRSCCTEWGHGGLSDPLALLQGLRLLIYLLAFHAGNNDLLSQVEAPGSRAVAAEGSGSSPRGRARLCRFLSPLSQPENSSRAVREDTPHFPLAAVMLLADLALPNAAWV